LGIKEQETHLKLLVLDDDDDDDVTSQYVLSVLTFVTNNRDQFFINSEIHIIKLGTILTFTCLGQILRFTKKESVIHVLRFSAVFVLTLEHASIIQGHLKRQLRFLYTNSF
jgi:hypothetical protein